MCGIVGFTGDRQAASILQSAIYSGITEEIQEDDTISCMCKLSLYGHDFSIG